MGILQSRNPLRVPTVLTAMMNKEGALKASDTMTLRDGINLLDDPRSDPKMSALLRAIVKHHMTLGLGYRANIQLMSTQRI